LVVLGHGARRHLALVRVVAVFVKVVGQVDVVVFDDESEALPVVAVETREAFRSGDVGKRQRGRPEREVDGSGVTERPEDGADRHGFDRVLRGFLFGLVGGQRELRKGTLRFPSRRAVERLLTAHWAAHWATHCFWSQKKYVEIWKGGFFFSKKKKCNISKMN
jgi:hypothetical protein